MKSPFLEIPEHDWIASNALAFAIYDRFPVSPGHVLVVPRRLVATWFEATVEEQQALMALVGEVKAMLDGRTPRPDGYNVGINAGVAAGQTVMHLHVHLIPRYAGDVADPRGGVRHVIPGKGNYLVGRGSPQPADSPALVTGGGARAFLGELQPLFARATDIQIVAAFVQDSGLALLRGPLLSALARGARVRLLTGDYFHITQVAALQRLLDWQEAAGVLFDEGEDGGNGEAPAGGAGGRLEARVVEVRQDGSWPRSFHPKSWCFIGEGFGVAYVGSSNISRTALTDGVEWNLRVRRDENPAGFGEVLEAFDAHWARARALDADWVEGYRVRAEKASRVLPPGEVEAAQPAPAPGPHALQREALARLEDARARGRERALVVHATGLGKTWLAAFDVQAYRARTNGGRVLFLAHRAEILAQAAETFRRLLPGARFGWFVGARSQLGGDVVFASVQKLGREAHLATLSPDAFDYVVVDEVHHAAAPSYRRILAHLEPRFVLGLTATPDRADEADILPLFDDHVAHRVSLAEGIAHGFLAPFRYFGLRDTTDYAPIPWRNRRFDPEALTRHVATQARMARIWEAMGEHPGTRTIAFCCSIEHAKFVRDWFAGRGLRAAAIFAAPDSDDRDAALRALGAGELDVVCAVDLLNEGVDIPAVDRVVMLRPTESPVVFLQQLGRGLRRADGKAHLTVLDFIGNHRIFLDRVRTLLATANDADAGVSAPPLRAWLDGTAALELPAGCEVDIELEAIDLLRRLLPKTSGRAVLRTYEELHNARGRRPTAAEMFHLGLNLRALRTDRGWFGFVAGQGHLSAAEQAALEVAGAWLHELETTPLQKSFKVVVVQALLDRDALFDGLPIDQLAAHCHRLIARSPELFADIADVRALGDPRHPDPAVWRRYWDGMPLRVWSGEYDRPIERPWFARDDGFFRSHVPAPPDPAAREALLAMTRELVEYRLAQYRARRLRDVEPDTSPYAAALSEHLATLDAYLHELGRYDALPPEQAEQHVVQALQKWGAVEDAHLPGAVRWVVERWRAMDGGGPA